MTAPPVFENTPGFFSHTYIPLSTGVAHCTTSIQREHSRRGKQHRCPTRWWELQVIESPTDTGHTGQTTSIEEIPPFRGELGNLHHYRTLLQENNPTYRIHCETGRVLTARRGHVSGQTTKWELPTGSSTTSSQVHSPSNRVFAAAQDWPENCVRPL